MNISIQNVVKTYNKGIRALDDVSIEITSPNMIGLVGPNGAGKSTLLKLLVAALLPDSGRILLDSEMLQKKEMYLKSILGYLPQSFGLHDDLNVWQFLDYMAALKNIKNSSEVIAKVVHDTNLDEIKKSKIRTLSGGQRQRTGIAQALIGDPALLILDEPTVSLDPEERINFRNLFSQYAQDKTVLLSTHIIEDVEAICGRIIAINQGKILFDGRPEELIQTAHGHVGIIEQGREVTSGKAFQITSRVNTARGVNCRIVAETLPSCAQPVEPSLEDAYIYLIGKGRRE